MDPYTAMVHAVQALRRRAERDRALLGALGVAADPLPHQVYNVARLLAAPDLRHLLADGVGLGKTVQTLMVLNALRLQDPTHRTLIVVPDVLVEQWITELETRGHSNVSFLDIEEERDDDPVRLVKPSGMVEHLESGPERFDLLVVDEPQTLTTRQREALARARPFPQFLALTATPELGRPEMMAWFAAMLEPHRRGTSDDPLAAIRRDETAALEGLNASGGLDGAVAFARDAFGRRICRWSRTDWPGYMPQRDYHRIDVPPFADEAALAMTARRVLRDAIGTDPTARARALHRVGRASRDALDALPPRVHEPPDGVDRDLGDSRLDALLDCLACIRGEGRPRALVVAGDNDTVARLTRILPNYFEDADGTRPRIGSLVRGEQTAADVEGAIRSTQASVKEFVSGTDDILLLGDWAEAGLNLHHDCDTLVLLSCPWRLRSVDQLIGRLDRLRPGAARLVEAGRQQGRVTIYAVSWAGSPEADVLDGLERLSVFERPMPPMSAERTEEVEVLMADLAAGRRREACLAELARIGGDGTGELAASPLAAHDPHTPDAAWAHHSALADLPALPGTLRPRRPEYGVRGPEESALTAWLEVLQASRLWEVRMGVPDGAVEGARHDTAWYADIGTRVPSDARPLPLDLFERRGEGDHRASPRTGMVAFLRHRRHLGDPPLRTATDREGQDRRLRFLDHGDALHEQLCNGILTLASREFGQTVPVCVVSFPPDHRAMADARPLLVSVASRHATLPAENEAALETSLGEVDERDRRYLRRAARAAARADERWFRLAAPRHLVLEGLTVDEQGRHAMLSRAEVEAVLDPRADGGRIEIRQPLVLPPAVARLRSAAPRRRLKAEAMAVPTPDRASTEQRIAVVITDTKRAETEASERARALRAQATVDIRQARIVETRAQRVEREAKAITAIAAQRRARLAASPVEAAATVWQIILLPYVRD